MNGDSVYTTTDIALCTALICQGYVIVDITKQISGKATFSFNKDDQLNDILKLYFDHQLNVDALTYFNYLKEVKTRIYNIRQ